MGFSTAVTAEPGGAQAFLLNSFLTAHLGFGAAAEHFVSLVWAKWCSGSCVSHPSPAAWLCHPISSTAAPAPDAVCSSWMWPLSLAEPSLVPCLRAVPSLGFRHHFSITSAPSCLFPKKHSDEGWAYLKAEVVERLLCLSEPICLIPQ